MTEYTTTCRSQRGCLATHIDRTSLKGRESDFSFESHVDRRRMKDNLYYVRDTDSDMRKLSDSEYESLTENGGFRQRELDYYKKNFKDGIKARNKRYGNAKAQFKTTVAGYYAREMTGCEEVLLQIGDKDSHPDHAVFESCVEDYMEKFNAKYGTYCRMLDAAIHNDEETPHAHIRRVWQVEDKNGARVSQEKALEAMGFSRPDPLSPKGIKNNRKIAFSEADRQLWKETCMEHGLSIKDAPEREKDMESHVAKEHFIDGQIARKERRLSSLQKEIAEKEAVLETLSVQVDEHKAAKLAVGDVDYFMRYSAQEGTGAQTGKYIIDKGSMDGLLADYRSMKADKYQVQLAKSEAEEKRKKASEIRMETEESADIAAEQLAYAEDEAYRELEEQLIREGRRRILEKAKMYDRIAREHGLPDPSYEVPEYSPTELFEDLQEGNRGNAFLDSVIDTEDQEWTDMGNK